MRLPLKDFQDIRVAELASKTRLAVGVASAGGGLQAISFAAPTGSGKTVMATALIERLLEGDEEAPPLDELAVLWISDQPELNQQTFSKMLLHSSALEPSQLKVVSASNFDQRVFGRQRVYFVNTQKLAKGAGLVDSEGDYRTHTFWQTVANTVEAGQTAFSSSSTRLTGECGTATASRPRPSSRSSSRALPARCRRFQSCSA